MQRLGINDSIKNLSLSIKHGQVVITQNRESISSQPLTSKKSYGNFGRFGFSNKSIEKPSDNESEIDSELDQYHTNIQIYEPVEGD